MIARFAGEGDQADGADRAGEIRTRVHRLAKGLEHDRGVDHPHARPAVCLGDEEPDDAEIPQPGPDRSGRPPVGVEPVADVRRDRRLLGQEPAQRLRQQLLVRRPLKIHTGELPDADVRS